MDNLLNEKKFLDEYDGTQYEKPSLTVDLVIFTIKDDDLKVLLIRRNEQPFKGMLFLPGVFVGIKESLDDAVKRVLQDKVGASDIYFEQLYTWGDVDRDPRMRIITVSYIALVPFDTLSAHCERKEIMNDLFSVNEVLNQEKEKNIELAFDHKKIIAYGRERIRNKTEYMPIAFQLLPEKFTIPDIQNIYEILLEKKIYKTNFRKKINDYICPTEEMTSGDAHRPSRIYVRSELLEKEIAL